MIYKEERGPIKMPFLFYWRLHYGKGRPEKNGYMIIRGVVNYFADRGIYDGIVTPYSSPYTALFRLFGYARFFSLDEPETLFTNIYHTEGGLKYLNEYKDEILKDISEIKKKVDEKYQILYNHIPNKGCKFSLLTATFTGKVVLSIKEELVTEESK